MRLKIEIFEDEWHTPHKPSFVLLSDNLDVTSIVSKNDYERAYRIVKRQIRKYGLYPDLVVQVKAEDYYKLIIEKKEKEIKFFKNALKEMIEIFRKNDLLRQLAGDLE